VGGLKWETSKETFRNYFLKFGPIEDCIVMKDTITGKSRGFGFITFEDPVSLQRVLKQDHIIDGKMVRGYVVFYRLIVAYRLKYSIFILAEG
jgi:RNA-binding protein Musashi